jgi:hypothetical protein
VADDEDKYIPLMVGMENQGRTIQMDDNGRGKLLDLGAAEPEQSGGIPKASLTGPSSVRKDDTMERLKAAAQEHVARSTGHREGGAPDWLNNYMVDQGLIEDPRFASAFEPFKDREDKTEVEDAKKRSDDLPDFSWAKQ